MLIRSFLALSALCLSSLAFSSAPAASNDQIAPHYQAQVPWHILDSLPPLHTLREEEIATIVPFRQDPRSIRVTLKNGTVYIYQMQDWDFEDSYPSTTTSLKEAIRSIKLIFSRAEYNPEFPGGQEAWDKYIEQFCKRHAAEIRAEGPAEITIHFTVHMKGQISDPEVKLNRNDSKLSELAKQAILESPLWIPATQNGRKVACYKD